MKKAHFSLLATAFTFSLFCPAEAVGGESNQTRIQAGVFTTCSSELWRGTGWRWGVYPAIQASHGRLYLRQLEAGVELMEKSQVGQIELFTRYNPFGYKASDSDFLEGMKNRDGTLEGGFRLSAEELGWKLSLEAAHDVFGKHKGWTGEIKLGTSVAISEPAMDHYGRTMLTGQIKAGWGNSSFTNYYFGVPEVEATPEREAYFSDAEAWYGGSLGLTFIQNDGWVFFSNFGVTCYGNSVKNSPIVRRSTQYKVGIGLGYNF